MTRRCAECGALIHACMGFVFAGDFMRAMQAIASGEVPMPPRELCGVCGAKDLTSKQDAILSQSLWR